MRKQASFRILVATDIHLGFKENHEVRGDDSFNAFREVLKYCQELQPDILLLGGDLFDTINPSQTCIYKCLRLLQESVFGDKDIDFDLVGMDANFLNSNLNIKLPIFTIHGNHDVPMQYGQSICDLLQACNYANYFGQHPNSAQVQVTPLTFTKQSTKVSIYGLGYIHPFRLSRLFKDRKITFQDPPSNSYNIVVIHQNRYKGKATGADYEECVHPELLPEWVDLIIWCHQHESIPKFTIEEGKKVYQPGSTVSTSLTVSEGLMKHVGLLDIKERKCELEPYYLKESHRPIVVVNMDLDDLIGINKDDLEIIIITKVQDQILYQAGERKQGALLPLVRVKIECSQNYQPKLSDLEKHFHHIVANHSDVFKLKKKKPKVEKREPKSEKKEGQFQFQNVNDLQAEFEQKLVKNMNKLPYLLQKPVEVQEIIRAELERDESGRGDLRALDKYMGRIESKVAASGIQEIKEYNQMMDAKYSKSIQAYKNVVLRNLEAEEYTEELERENEKELENVTLAAEFQALCETRINKTASLSLEAIMQGGRFKNREEFVSKMEFKQDLGLLPSPGQDKHKKNHKHSHDSHDEFEEQKCCPKEDVEFDVESQNRFIEMNELVQNENGKQGKKGKKNVRSRSKSKGKSKKPNKPQQQKKVSSKKRDFL